jgi:hypothetical protein|nr:MAG TPA: virion structural protein [Caudoviricetes sp.]DAN53244.1 MAG TPA: virion structural protein [Bacteriophage sp.]DAW36427.1 MAG TPA: virion structural protein [Caudoviricetes sp.]
MADQGRLTLQSNIKRYNGADMHKYSLFLGGLNVTHRALAQYDPLKTGYARIFFVQMPAFMKVLLPEATKQFRHLLEYGFVGIDGIQNLQMDYDPITGGYAGRSFEVPIVAKDDTNSITIKLYEFAGSPVREYTNMWITGMADQYTGFGTYHGLVDPELCKNFGVSEPFRYAQQYHTAEAIYVQTDPTGLTDNIEYAALFTNMMPKASKADHFNYDSGQHPLVQVDLEFTATKYESPQINQVAKALLKKYQVMKSYLKFHSGYTLDQINNDGLFPKSEIENWIESDNSFDGIVNNKKSFTTTGQKI